ncbi:MAG: hypothetical protein R3E63_04425 [Pseudomonadales bacterium]
MAMSPNGQQTADNLNVVTQKRGGVVILSCGAAAKGRQTFTLVLVGGRQSLKQSIGNCCMKTTMLFAKKQFFISEKPPTLLCYGYNNKDWLYDVNIGRTPYAEDVTSSSVAKQVIFSMWGAELERGDR